MPIRRPDYPEAPLSARKQLEEALRIQAEKMAEAEMLISSIGRVGALPDGFDPREAKLRDAAKVLDRYEKENPGGSIFRRVRPEIQHAPAPQKPQKRRRRIPVTQDEVNAAGSAAGNKHSQNRISLLWGRHAGQDAFVVGTGTSLAGFRFEVLSGRDNAFTIGLNDAVMARGFVPDYSLFCDVGIWSRYRLLDLDPRTLMVCQGRARQQFMRFEDCKFRDRVWHFNHVSQAKSCDPLNDDLFVARTVATGAIMMAYKLGASRVFLLGVDGYKVVGPDAPIGGVYYHDGRGKGVESGRRERNIGEKRVEQDRHEWWRQNMVELREWLDRRAAYQQKWPGAGVFNLSEHSTIGTWDKVPIREVLGDDIYRS